jgi:hypothetical protein
MALLFRACCFEAMAQSGEGEMADSMESKAAATTFDQPRVKSDGTHERQREPAGDPAAGPVLERAVSQVEDFTRATDGELVEPGYGHGV